MCRCCRRPACGILRPQHDFTRQRSGGRFAVRAGDGDDRPGKKLGGQLDFANDRFAERARLNQWRRIDGNTGADHDQILSAESPFAVTSGFDRDAWSSSSGISSALVWRLGVGNGDACASRLQK